LPSSPLFHRFALVCSTLPHLFAVRPAAEIHWGFGSIVFASSLCSIAWHWLGEGPPLLTRLDYSLAAAWTVAELVWAPPGFAPGFARVLALNGIVFALNQMADHLSHTGRAPYWVCHSLWHLCSAAKALAVLEWKIV
jgi:hypothetical protein